MKKSVIIGIILALIVVCLAIVLVVNLNDKANTDEILVSDTNQVEVLKKIISSEVPMILHLMLNYIQFYIITLLLVALY